ncbi:META domain-containing protein [Acetobacter lambici]|uniref:META domain-containing protein n=1 Tax=Acetobacter lambici TaxID=1332824 RepID=A0ABT1EZ99_9PROT|nr:META domain-containing protein [Acetobacter lambici]MCP1242226.1 META domain-containing protein [Acetobacter lambici]MCP1258243.1 META domain-containing protein [Acetobacter lambici]
MAWPRIRSFLAPGALALVGACAAQTQPIATTGTDSSVYEARGNEPFWNFSMASGTLALSTPDGPRLTRLITRAYTRGDTRHYEAPDLAVAITPTPCQDSMSGQMFTQTVSITTKEQTLNGCGGNLVPPTRLNATRWVATQLDGHTLRNGNVLPDAHDSATDENPDPAADMFTPTLDINDTGKVSGSDGCNRYAGGLVFGHDGKVSTAPQAGISTLMACPGAHGQVSTLFLALLHSVQSWTMEDGTLVLHTQDGKTMRLRQTF